MVTREARRRRDGHQGGSAEEGWSPGRLSGGGMVGERVTSAEEGELPRLRRNGRREYLRRDGRRERVNLAEEGLMGESYLG